MQVFALLNYKLIESALCVVFKIIITSMSPENYNEIYNGFGSDVMRMSAM